MPDTPYNVLFLCTHNSARSVMAECVLNRVGARRFRAWSAGSHPTGRLNPHVVDHLRQLGHATDGLRSKSWDEFAAPGAPAMDFVFTVCDSAAGEACPVWPGQPITAHWPFADPSSVQGSDAEARARVAELYRRIERRIAGFAALPIAMLDRLSLQRRLDALGGSERTPA